MKNKYLSFLSVSALAVSVQLLVTERAHAEIFKCVNAKAEVFFNDKPCPWTQIERKIKAAKDPKYGYVPPAFVEKTGTRNAQGVIVGGVSNKEINSSQQASGEKQQTGNNSTQGSVSSQDYGSKQSAGSQDSLKVSDSRNIRQIPNTIEDRMHRERMQRKRMKLTQ